MTGLLVDRDEPGIVVVTLNRPDRRNALDDVLLLEELPSVFSDLAGDTSVRAVILTGKGGAFCAGADLECSGLSQPTQADSERWMTRSHQTVQLMRSLPHPLIAAIEGPSVGAGLGLALGCDFRVAAPSAFFQAPLIKMALPPDFGTSFLLPRVVGAERALDMFLTGRTVPASEALAMGLVSDVAADPSSVAKYRARAIAELPPGAVVRIKRLVYSGLDSTLTESVRAEVRSVAEAMHGEEFSHALGSWRARILGE